MSTASFPSGLIAKAQSHVSHIIELSCRSCWAVRCQSQGPSICLLLNHITLKKWGWGQKASSFTHWGPYLKLSIWVLMFLPAFAFEGDPINPIYLYFTFSHRNVGVQQPAHFQRIGQQLCLSQCFYWTRSEVELFVGGQRPCAVLQLGGHQSGHATGKKRVLKQLLWQSG